MSMRLSFWNRLWSALSGLLIVLAAVGLFVFGIGVFPFQLDLSMLQGPFELWQRAAMVAVSIVLLLLGLHGIALLFKRDKHKGFIIQHAEFGDMSISLTALESMVKKCVSAHQELEVNAIRIHHSREGIVVDIKVTLASGVNIPLTVNALQKQIKQYITSCSGVDVHKVRVMVETDAAKLAAPEPEPAPVEAEAQPESAHAETPAEHIFQHTEEPASYAEPVENAEVEVPQAPESIRVEMGESAPADEHPADGQPDEVEESL